MKKLIVMMSIIIFTGFMTSLIAQKKDQTITVNGVTFTMKYVEGGTFSMGTDDPSRDDREHPAHKVTLSSYYIAETEVTQALFRAVMGYSFTEHRNRWENAYNQGVKNENKIKIPMYGTGDEYPAYYLSWDDCQVFLKKLNNLTGKNFRLPTEAEWEYAARGGKKTKGYIFSGSNKLSEVGWITPETRGHIRPVKQKKPNELGLYDMTGNVAEWCSDWDDYYEDSHQTNPQGPSKGYSKIVRGGGCGIGGFEEEEEYVVTVRDDFDPEDRVASFFDHLLYHLGIRLVLSTE